VPEVRVSTLAASLKVTTLVPGSPDVIIRAVTNDSRSVSQGSLYAALPGEHTDGHRFIGDAVDSGAVAILCSELPETPDPDVA
jgi:UDP-N-acetylmuramoyl-L-alanyl-D-glutamate--2,6-diaminopimelate ligase